MPAVEQAQQPGCPGEEALAEFAAGAAAGPQGASVESHLASCADCAWLVGRLIGDRNSIEGSPLPAPAGGAPEVRAAAPSRYLLREVLGAGGMGTVYEAESLSLGRRVALKLLRENPPRPARRERFLREARITAMLEHPNIVPVLEVGELEDGVPFYTQRLVRGRTLAKAIAACKGLPDRLRLLPHFLDLCNAIAYAHGKGVIHRDLKPGNVVVGDFGETAVVDWGLARQKDGPRDTPSLGSSPVSSPPGLTMDGQTVGTPGYMSPEQASGHQELVDERSDVFSLGAVLFELLVGRPPFTGKSDEEVLRRVISGPPPEADGSGVPPDLAAVARKALSRERSDRYANAGELEEDVAAWSEGRAVAAYRYTRLQRTQRAMTRHPALSAGLLITVLLGGGWLGSAFGKREEQRRNRSEELVMRGYSYSRSQLWDRAAVYYAQARLLDDSPLARWGLAAVGRTGVVPLYKLKRHLGSVRAVAFSPDGAQFASAADDRTLRIFDVPTGLERQRLELADVPSAMLYAPDGKSVACAAGAAVELWDLGRGARSGRIELPGRVQALAQSRDGALLAAAIGPEALVFERTGGKIVARTRLEGPVDAVAFLPWGDVALAGAALDGVRLWTPRPGAGPRQVGPPTAHPQRLASCGGGRLASADRDGNGYYWELQPDEVTDHTLVLAVACREVALSDDCGTLLCLGDVGGVRIWDAASRQSFVGISGSHRGVTSAAVSSQGLFAVGSADHAVRLWSLGQSRSQIGARGAGGHPTAVAWSPDGTLLASTSLEGIVQLWNPQTGQPMLSSRAHEGPARAVAFPPLGGPWATAGADGVRLWQGHFGPPTLLSPDSTSALAFSPSAPQLLVAGRQDGALRFFAPAGAGPEVLPGHRGEVRALAFSPDGARLASGGVDGVVLLWDARARTLLARIEGHEDEVRALAFSPDGRLLVSAGIDRTLRLWDPQDGHALGTLQGDNTGEVQALAFGPLLPGNPTAGKLLAGTSPSTLELWDVQTRAPLLSVSMHFLSSPVSLAFAPDGKRAAVLGSDGSLRVKDLTAVDRLGSPEEDFQALLKLYKYKVTRGDFERDEDALKPPAER